MPSLLNFLMAFTPSLIIRHFYHNLVIDLGELLPFFNDVIKVGGDHLGAYVVVDNVTDGFIMCRNVGIL